MKKIGLLLGAALWLDTTSEDIAEQAEQICVNAFDAYYGSKPEGALDAEVDAIISRNRSKDSKSKV